MQWNSDAGRTTGMGRSMPPRPLRRQCDWFRQQIGIGGGGVKLTINATASTVDDQRMEKVRFDARRHFSVYFPHASVSR